MRVARIGGLRCLFVMLYTCGRVKTGSSGDHLASVLLIFESLLARDEFHHAAFGMSMFTVALEAAIRAVRIDRPLIVTLYR